MSEGQVLQHASVIYQVVVIVWNYLVVCMFELKLAIG